MRESAARGFYPGSTISFGYKGIKGQDWRKKRSKLIPDLSAAPTVSRIFEECVAGKGLREIAILLNNEGNLAPKGTTRDDTSGLSIVSNGTPWRYILRVPYLPVTPHKVATLA